MFEGLNVLEYLKRHDEIKAILELWYAGSEVPSNHFVIGSLRRMLELRSRQVEAYVAAVSRPLVNRDGRPSTGPSVENTYARYQSLANSLLEITAPVRHVVARREPALMYLSGHSEC